MRLVDTYIRNLTKAAKDDKICWEVIMPAVENLKGKNRIQEYFNAIVNTTIEQINEDIINGDNVKVTRKISDGVPIKDIAHAISIQNMKYLLSNYDSKKYKSIHEAWNKSIPEIYPNGKLENILEF